MSLAASRARRLASSACTRASSASACRLRRCSSWYRSRAGCCSRAMSRAHATSWQRRAMSRAHATCRKQTGNCCRSSGTLDMATQQQLRTDSMSRDFALWPLWHLMLLRQAGGIAANGRGPLLGERVHTPSRSSWGWGLIQVQQLGEDINRNHDVAQEVAEGNDECVPPLLREENLEARLGARVLEVGDGCTRILSVLDDETYPSSSPLFRVIVVINSSANSC